MAQAEELREERRTVLAGVAALGAAIGLFYTHQRHRLERASNELERDANRTDRYTKAVEQLGHESIHIRLGGVYALERVMQDSPKDAQTVMDVLCAFVRESANTPAPDGQEDGPLPGKAPATDLQAALTVIGRSPSEISKNLAHAQLSGADLSLADLSRAYMVGTDLTGAYMTGADLTGAILVFAKLIDASMPSADLTDANLTGANLTDASLVNADLTRANLRGANLRRADLRGADLTDANLTSTGPSPKGLSSSIWNAHGPHKTIWPEGFTPDHPPEDDLA
ncbi:hypothetical protein GCM10025865_33840 (plasmid) [Paraoerskovia sediminicola]|uniref:Pentapeptide repeat-containing protein n=1 Tax=Paraoerskovia sediminicola TaxID=1138587 RepID=A0ABM8G7E8_9CELL|nr:hypothetical protein GCM10025865_33400 [Paraoerskovia sediminicola]BDZ44085.1 hypothetical protein GCM10025865_33840 [Paraoerskovia sediminicola]